MRTILEARDKEERKEERKGEEGYGICLNKVREYDIKTILKRSEARKCIRKDVKRAEKSYPDIEEVFDLHFKFRPFLYSIAVDLNQSGDSVSEMV